MRCHNGEPLNVFYEKLHVILQEIDCLHPNELTNPSDVARRHKEIEINQVYDFHRGLDPQFDGVRNRILALTPVPSILEAYVIVIEENTRQLPCLQCHYHDGKFYPL